MIKKQSTYTIDEVKTHLDKYLAESAERLRARLRIAWKKQAAHTKVYDKTVR